MSARNRIRASSTLHASSLKSAPKKDIVLLLPGIMGSHLYDVEPPPPYDPTSPKRQHIWLDLGILTGEIFRLRVPDGPRGSIVPLLKPLQRSSLDLIYKIYRPLIEDIQNAGFVAQPFPYDWRLSLAHNGQLLAQEVQRLNALGREVHLVGHSMGGLVIRGALAKFPPTSNAIASITTIATPNLGSVRVIEALANTHETVRFLTKYHGIDALLGRVFSTFQGLIDLLPARSLDASGAQFDVQKYPTRVLLNQSLLSKADGLLDGQLSNVDQRFTQIVGTGLPTPIAVRQWGDTPQGMIYHVDQTGGDGTVSLTSAIDARAKRVHMVSGSHMNLPKEQAVRNIVLNVLTGSPSVEPSVPSFSELAGRETTSVTGAHMIARSTAMNAMAFGEDQALECLLNP